MFCNVSFNITADCSHPQWHFLPVCSTVLTFLIVLCNGAVLITFFRARILTTPFNVYLLNLLLTNLLHAILVNPLDIAAMLFPRWPYSSATCTLYLYFQRTGDAVMINSHVLICVNRLWAVAAPLSYRLHHTRRLAVTLCAGLWLWANSLLLPQIVQDALFVRPPGVCHLDVRPQWALAVSGHFLLFVFPLILMITSYPLLLCLRRRRPRRIYQESDFGNSFQMRGRCDSEDIPAPARRKHRSKAFTILTLLTVSVTICWSPLLILFTMTFFMDYFDSAFYQIGSVLFLLEPLCDPLYFAIVLHDLRKAFGLTFATTSGVESTSSAVK
ncbi:tyramine receptor 1-like [Paramacrobiotus metropolitanus]|uniref:tyramine receptor 1-like n=1 Tax=Paramacrobiotus metropolitanus TaxID=2943436 RepID=UPI002445C717|nr:tyramine receptor 1-like [Paramacrobiotus metropolitanus]